MGKLSEEYKNEIQEIFGEIYSKYMSLELENIKNTLDTELSKKVLRFKDELIKKIDSVTNYDEKLNNLISEINEQENKIGTLATSEGLKNLIKGFNEQNEKLEILANNEVKRETLIKNNYKFMKIILWVLASMNAITLALLLMKI